MEESNVTNLGGFISNTPNQNDTITNNVVGAEIPRVDYTNVYNQVSNMITNNASDSVTINPQAQPVSSDTLQQVQSTVELQQTPLQAQGYANNVVQTNEQVNKEPVVQEATIQQASQQVATTINNTETVLQTTHTPTDNTEVVINNAEDEVKEVETKEPIITDKFVVNTDDFVEMINNAKKAAICEPLLTTTMVIELLFTPDGLKVASTDSANTFVQVNSNIKYTQELRICVLAEKISKLVNKIKDPQITFSYNVENRTITLTTDSGTFILSEIYDNTTFKPINIENPNLHIQPTDTVYDIDIENLKFRINKARQFMGDANVQSNLNGVYFTDTIYCTNIANICGITNVPELVGEEFYLGGKFIKLLTELNFDKGKIAIRKSADNIPVGVIFDDGVMMLSGPVHDKQNDYPLQKLLPVFTTEFPNSFKIDKDKLLNILEIGTLFINDSRDKDSCDVQVTSNKLIINSIDGTAKQESAITDCNVLDFKFSWNILDTIRALQNCENKDITIYVDTTNSKAFKIVENELTQMLSMINL